MKTRILLITMLGLAACGGEPSSPQVSLPVSYGLVALSDVDTPEKMAARCEADEAAFRERLAAIEGFDGTPAIRNYYLPLDSLISSATTLQSHASSLSRIHPDPSLQSAAEACDLLINKFFSDLSLSRPVYDALSRLDTSKADAETRYSVEKSLLSYKLAGVDKDDETRERIRTLNEEIAAIGQEFNRNIRDDVRYLELDSVEDLAGLPEDYIASHPPNEDGKIVISTQYPDVLPFLEYAENDALRKEMLTLFNSRAYPQNEPV
jgi:thimet oligopeptidase